MNGLLFQKIPNSKFPELKEEVMEGLSTDQHYTYRICMAVMLDIIKEDLQCLEIDPIVNSRWLTRACCILCYYTSITDAPDKLAILAKFGIKVLCFYFCNFSTWFDIKSNNSITDDPRNFLS